MTGHELLEALQQMSSRELDLPVGHAPGEMGDLEKADWVGPAFQFYDQTYLLVGDEPNRVRPGEHWGVRMGFGSAAFDVIEGDNA